jgi:gluconolactonase
MIEQSKFIVYADEFYDVIGPDPGYDTVANVNAHEGPVYARDWDAVLYTTVPVTTNVPAFGDRLVSIGRLDVATHEISTYLEVTNMANGMTLDREGRLLICEQGMLNTPAAISRLDLGSGEREVIVDDWLGQPFNSTNDVVVKSDGTIWFTDPSYGSLQGFRPPPLIGSYVYRYDPADRSVTVVADSFNKPNGLAFSVDESILYINDSGAIQGPGTYFPANPHHIRTFDVVNGRTLAGDRLFATVVPGIPDGLKVDSKDRVYSSCFSGVKVYDRGGKLLGEILAPGVANFCFGGKDGNMLFMMCDNAINIATLAATGA